MSLYKVEALVLKGSDFSEADRILTIYTREEGKFNIIAKGVKKIKSRMRGSVQPFCHSGFVLYSGRGGLDTLTQADLIEPFAALRYDLSRLAYANYMIEALGLVPERQPQQELFLLLIASLHLLLVQEPSAAAAFWLVRMLECLGYGPRLTSCAACGEHWEASDVVFFNPEQGGILCGTCAAKMGGMKIHQGTLAVWRFLREVSAGRVQRLKIGGVENKELHRMLRFYLEYLLERPLKSSAFLDASQSMTR